MVLEKALKAVCSCFAETATIETNEFQLVIHSRRNNDDDNDDKQQQQQQFIEMRVLASTLSYALDALLTARDRIPVRKKKRVFMNMFHLIRLYL